MSDEPRNYLDDPKIRIRPLGEAAVEMTMRQWVETLPPGHRARKELAMMIERLEYYAGQLKRLPGTTLENRYRVDHVLQRLVDTESALASLVHLLTAWSEDKPEERNDWPEGLGAAFDTAEKILDARPSALGGTARRADITISPGTTRGPSSG